ncbi:MAG: recombinase family protein [Polyangiaceae bacterium]|nr:recombinase family protein [Polyangiaceae bacterium]
MAKRAERARWVSYLRVSTVEQAEKELSLTAQRRSAEEFAARHGAVIDHHYVEPGASGTDAHRAVFNELLGDALRPGSTIATIVVHHTSRFTRDATHARVVKKELRRAGVRVLSTSQELSEDPTGTLMEGFFECIDQYESEVNGIRTSAAMREAVRQGFYPGGRMPYGDCKVPVEVRAGAKPRFKLEILPSERAVLCEMYRLYITGSGALKVAEALNELGFRTRKGSLWDKGAVIQTLQQSAASGVVRWGVRYRGKIRPPSEWLTLAVEPIIDAKTYALVRKLCKQRRPTENPGRASTKPRVLTGLAVCGKCGSSYQLETSGKSLDGATYEYCYYNCRTTLRAGKKACSGFRIRTSELDRAVLEKIADLVCTPERAKRLARRHNWPPTGEVLNAWRNFILRDHDIGRTYALHLIERIHVHGERIVISPKEPCGRRKLEMHNTPM